MKHILLAAAFAAFFVSNAVAQECTRPDEVAAQVPVLYGLTVSVSLRDIPNPMVPGDQAMVFERPVSGMSNVVVFIFRRGCLLTILEMSRQEAYDLMMFGPQVDI